MVELPVYAGVAVARNAGVEASSTKYIYCLEVVDAIDREFIRTMVPARPFIQAVKSSPSFRCKTFVFGPNGVGTQLPAMLYDFRTLEIRSARWRECWRCPAFRHHDLSLYDLINHLIRG